MPASGSLTLSVVMASDGAMDRIPDRLAALARACRGIAAEVVLVVPSGVEPTAVVDPPLKVRTVGASSGLVPVQWGHGILAASGPIVALTTSQFRVTDDWAYALLRVFETTETVAVGGRIALAPGTGYLGRAAHLVRYSEHMSETLDGAPRDPAGENAAYRRGAVLSACPDLREGFWEVDVHRVIRSDGGIVSFDPAVVAEFAPVVSLRGMLRNRFLHGGHFGTHRVEVLGWNRWLALAVTPLVPFLLLMRILRRAARAGHRPWSVLTVVPAVLTLLVAWAAGEAHGAFRSGSPVRHAD